ncbi:MAG TPA: hypothetical protein VGE36_13740 [Roseateles sp.]
MARSRTSGTAKAAAPADVVAAAKAALSAGAARRATVQAAAVTEAPLSAADRENPDKLSGAALRALAHRRGVSRSEAEGMSDDKLRMQLRYITHRQYTED